MVARNGIQIIDKAMEKLFRKYAQVAAVIIFKIPKSQFSPSCQLFKLTEDFKEAKKVQISSKNKNQQLSEVR